MKKLVPLFLAAIMMACNGTGEKAEEKNKLNEATSNKEAARSEIEALEGELMNKLRSGFDEELAKRVVDFYVTYANNNPKDEYTPEYLFKAGEVSIGLKEFDQAVGYFERVYKNYPEFNKRVESLYLIGFTYDEHMDKYGKAKEYYQKVIDNHPDHEFADDAKASIETLGMSDEELIKKFEEKNKEAMP